MKRISLVILLTLNLAGCAAVQHIQDIWPKDHDPAMVSMWVDVKVALDAVDCDRKPTGWEAVVTPAKKLAIYTDFRQDPQRDNVKGLAIHADKMSQGGSAMFCKLGKQTAQERLAVARKAWEGR